MPLEFSAVLGTDVAGIVDQEGERVAKLAVGDEVLGTAVTGSFAESALADPEQFVVRLPANGAGKRTLIRVLTTLLEQ
jgi:NADPH:quinone reductase-like Zn-dependent oxidoreductase